MSKRCNRTKRGIIATLVVGGIVAAGVSALISNYWGDDYSTDIAIMKANIARLAQTNRDQLEALQAATKAMHHYTIATDAYVLTLAENIMQQTKMLAYQLDQSNTHVTTNNKSFGHSNSTFTTDKSNRVVNASTPH